MQCTIAPEMRRDVAITYHLSCPNGHASKSQGWPQGQPLGQPLLAHSTTASSCHIINTHPTTPLAERSRVPQATALQPHITHCHRRPHWLGMFPTHPEPPQPRQTYGHPAHPTATAAMSTSRRELPRHRRGGTDGTWKDCPFMQGWRMDKGTGTRPPNQAPHAGEPAGVRGACRG